MYSFLQQLGLLFAISVLGVVCIFEDLIYYNVIDVSSCVYRLNGTHTTGCTSKINGNIGALYFIYESLHLDQFEIIAHDGAHPYTLVLSLNLFTRNNVLKLRKLHKGALINGAIFHYNDFNRDNFSNEDKIPNRHIGFYAEQNENDLTPWNTFGTGLLHEHFEFPIFLIKIKKEFEKLEKCFKTFNEKYPIDEHKLRPLCTVRLRSFMSARTNSRVCLWRTKYRGMDYCDPLSSRNIYSNLIPAADLRKTPLLNNLILLAARLDTTSFFSDIAPGAVTVVTNLVTLLATVNLLRKLVDRSTPILQKNLMVTLFSGESYDFMGSQRFVFDLKSKQLYQNFDFEQISLMIELNQLTNSDSFYVHYDQLIDNNTIITQFLQKLQKKFIDVNLALSPYKDKIIPPSSIQSFLVEKRNFPGIMLTSFGQSYNNMYYNSIFDTGKRNLNYTYKERDSKTNIQAVIQKISTSLAYTLFELMNENVSGNANELTADLELIDELLYCYLENLNCKFHQRLQIKFKDEVPSFYVNVEKYKNQMPSYIAMALVWLFGLPLPTYSQEECNKHKNNEVNNYFWLPESLNPDSKNVCYFSQTILNISKSPAFDIENYDWNSKMFSTWTESMWTDIKMEMFIKPSVNTEFIAVTTGFLIFCASCFIIYFLNVKAAILFSDSS